MVILQSVKILSFHPQIVGPDGRSTRSGVCGTWDCRRAISVQPGPAWSDGGSEPVPAIAPVYCGRPTVPTPSDGAGWAAVSPPLLPSCVLSDGAHQALCSALPPCPCSETGRLLPDTKRPLPDRTQGRSQPH